MIRVLFPNGTVVEAEDADELLEIWREKEWNRDLPEHLWSNELARRAWVWSGTVVNPALRSDELLEELAHAGLVKIKSKGESE